MKKFLMQSAATLLCMALAAIAAPVMRAFEGPTITLPTFKQPGVPAFFEKEVRVRENAPIEVALVFGRSVGCTDADPQLISTVAREAVNAGLPPKLLASTIALESQCSTFAISSKGAVGLTQVQVKTWKSSYDFSKVNLFNPQDNIHIGARIMAGLVKEHGLSRGVQLYNGAGVGCDTCDSGYSNRVIALAGGRQ